MKNFLPLVLLALILSAAGCATTDDLKETKLQLSQAMETSLTRVDADVAALKKDMAKNTEAVSSTRKGNANTAADIADLRDNIQQLRGQIDALRKDIAGNKKKEEEYQNKLDDIVLRINFIENFLEIGGRSENRGDAAAKTPVAAALPAKEPVKKLDKESMYSMAYQIFKEGNYGKARTEFQNFLAVYPETEYSDNAQFWIGECYFFEKNYEKAILEYEKVIKNYPGGNKVSYALLKQGLSFLKLNDKTSAKLLLQQVIKDYPNTNQARIARAKLQEIK